MGHVKGIGGLFFRAKDPEKLSAWYRERLGVGGGCSADDSVPPNQWVWNVTAGPLVFSPFKADTDYFAADKQWMLNLRVDDLKGLMAQLQAAGIAVETRTDWDGDGSYGTFARIHDPEGTPIELWQPPD